MTKNSIREKSRNARKARLQRTRILLGVVGVLLVAVIAIFAFQSGSQSGKDANTSGTPGGSVITQSGLKYEDLVVGSGPKAKQGDQVTVHYTGWLTDGTKFDSSVDRGTPFTFVLGVGNVIAGWDEGVVGMQVGGKRKLTIPPELGYGANGAPPAIPANATLVFEVELISIK